MRRIAIINQKGGVGKTTTTANLAAALAQAGKRTFLIDLDPQGHLSLHFGLNVQPDQATVYDVLTAATPIAEAKVAARENIDLLPADIDLAAAEAELVSVTGREVLLREAVEAFGNGYDALLIDCAPSLGVLTINALAACTEVVIPLQAHFFGLQGLSKLLETVVLVRQRINPQLKVSGIALCMHEASTRLATEIAEDLTKFLEAARGGDKPWAAAQLYQTPIRRNIKLAESSSFGQTVFDYAPRSNGALDYANLAAEIFPDLPKPAAMEEEPPATEPVVTKARAAVLRDVPAKRIAQAAQPAMEPPAVVNPPAKPPIEISNCKPEISNTRSETAKPKSRESNRSSETSDSKLHKSNPPSSPASKAVPNSSASTNGKQPASRTGGRGIEKTASPHGASAADAKSPPPFATAASKERSSREPATASSKEKSSREHDIASSHEKASSPADATTHPLARSPGRPKADQASTQPPAPIQREAGIAKLQERRQPGDTAPLTKFARTSDEAGAHGKGVYRSQVAQAPAKVKKTSSAVQPAPLVATEANTEPRQMPAPISAKPRPARTESPRGSTDAPLVASVSVIAPPGVGPTAAHEPPTSPIVAQKPADKPIRKRSVPHTVAVASGSVPDPAARRQAEAAGV